MGVAALADLRRWVRESSSPYVRAVAAKILGPLVARGEGGLEDLVAGLEDADSGRPEDVRPGCERLPRARVA